MKCDVHPKYSGKGAPRSRCTACNRIFVKVNAGKSDEDLARILKVQLRTIRDYRVILGLPAVEREKDVVEEVHDDIEKSRTKRSKKDVDKKYVVLQEENQRLLAEHDAILQLSGPINTFNINTLGKHAGGESTSIAVASDWHGEEEVKLESTNGINQYNLEIAKKCATEFFQTVLKFRNLDNNNTPTPQLVLALLGDFITGNLELKKQMPTNTLLEPVDAAAEVMMWIKSGIDFLLKESDLQKIIVPCHVGNHSRITPKSAHSGKETGNSLETFMYTFLAKAYEGNQRIEFRISPSYKSRLQIYDTVFRLHHGHRIRFAGGVGGLDVPANKYIMRANRAWPADFDIFGHHHTKKPSTHFFANGSMIGTTGYSDDEAFEFEPRSQTYLLVHNRFAKEVIEWRPILFSV